MDQHGGVRDRRPGPQKIARDITGGHRVFHDGRTYHVYRYAPAKDVIGERVFLVPLDGGAVVSVLASELVARPGGRRHRDLGERPVTRPGVVQIATAVALVAVTVGTVLYVQHRLSARVHAGLRLPRLAAVPPAPRPRATAAMAAPGLDRDARPASASPSA